MEISVRDVPPNHVHITYNVGEVKINSFLNRQECDNLIEHLLEVIHSLLPGNDDKKREELLRILERQSLIPDLKQKNEKV